MKHGAPAKFPSTRLLDVAYGALRLYFAPCFRAGGPVESGVGRSASSVLRYALLFATLLGVGFGLSQFLLPPPFGESIVTRAGEWKSLTLADGSVIHASPNTRLNVRYRAGYRRIALRRGEAIFKVAKEPSRPFTVRAGNREARAVGTEFRMAYAPPNEVQVTVMEGVVQVSKLQRAPAASSPVEEFSLDAGKMASLSTNDVVISEPGETRRVRLEDNAVVIDHAAIGEVVAQLNLRGNPKIVIDDPRVAAMVIRRIFLTGLDSENYSAPFTSLIATSPNIAEYRRGDDLHLTSEPGSCPPWLICSDSR